MELSKILHLISYALTLNNIDNTTTVFYLVQTEYILIDPVKGVIISNKTGEILFELGKNNDPTEMLNYLEIIPSIHESEKNEMAKYGC